MKQQPQNQASGASETTRFFCTRISSAASAAGELCTGKRKEPDMAKRENEGKKEKKQKKERAKERKEDKEKTIRGFITKPNISTACAYARVRGAPNRLHLLVRGGGRSGDGDHRQLLRLD